MAEELAELKQYLENRGVLVATPMLPGHGTKPEDLNKVNGQDWISASEKELENLKKNAEKIFVGGTSLGGNIALILAKDHKVGGIISMGAPIFFNRGLAMKIGLFLLSAAGLSKLLIKKRYPSSVPADALEKRRHYLKFPAKSVGDALTVIEQSKQFLPEVNAPILIIQSSHDHLVNPKSAQYIFDSIGSQKKELEWLNHSYHLFILDSKRELIFERIYQFIDKHR